ncbi:MAG: SRPBCC family protein [Burkholderiales bacterium]
MAGRDHVFRATTIIPRSIDEVFPFFAAAENLEVITPPELGFEVLTPAPIVIAEGTIIDYRLRLFGLPFRWRTRIARWDPPHQFVDEQLKGPYRKWVHTHTFREVDGGTEMTDEVRYRLPLPPFGDIGYPVVRLQVKRIFAYRRRQLDQLLAPAVG